MIIKAVLMLVVFMVVLIVGVVIEAVIFAVVFIVASMMMIWACRIAVRLDGKKELVVYSSFVLQIYNAWVGD